MTDYIIFDELPAIAAGTYDGYYIAFVQNPRTDRVIESVAPCSSLEDAWVWFKGYWRSEDGFTVSDVQPYQGGSAGNETPEGA